MSGRFTTAREPRESGCSGSEMVEMRSVNGLAALADVAQGVRQHDMLENFLIRRPDERNSALDLLTVDLLLVDRLCATVILAVRLGR